MRLLVFTIGILAGTCAAYGQSFNDSIAQYRQKYTAGLLEDKRAPINSAQVKNLNFFAPDRDYCVVAEFKETPGTVPFMMPTHSGKLKPFRKTGVLLFTLKGQKHALYTYQGVDFIKDGGKDYLFVPFRDLTNYVTTYGGGRYIDLSIKDIADGKIQLDFNKCYNPYCAYADGFNCPIPPRENSLPVEISAGEKTFTR
jgi:uncharacterized protein (DUF1684 family)